MSAYQVRVSELIEQLQREDPDAYVRVSTWHEGQFDNECYWETEALAVVNRIHDCKRYVELRGEGR